VPEVPYMLSNILLRSQPKGVQQKMKGHKLRSDVNWQRTLKRKGKKLMGVKQGLPVFTKFKFITTIQSKKCLLYLNSFVPQDLNDTSAKFFQVLTGMS
jgi:hypothetical protein